MSDRALQVVRLLWVLGYLVGTTTHVVDLVLATARPLWAWFGRPAHLARYDS